MLPATAIIGHLYDSCARKLDDLTTDRESARTLDRSGPDTELCTHKHELLDAASYEMSLCSVTSMTDIFKNAPSLTNGSLSRIWPNQRREDCRMVVTPGIISDTL